MNHSKWNKLIDLLELKAKIYYPEFNGEWILYFNKDNQYLSYNELKIFDDFDYAECIFCRTFVSKNNWNEIVSEEHVLWHLKQFNLLPFI